MLLQIWLYLFLVVHKKKRKKKELVDPKSNASDLYFGDGPF
jgi:hypothetical protein